MPPAPHHRTSAESTSSAKSSGGRSPPAAMRAPSRTKPAPRNRASTTRSSRSSRSARSTNRRSRKPSAAPRNGWKQQQNCDGSWPWTVPAGGRLQPKARRLLPGERKGEVDMTGAALEALNAAEHPDPEGPSKAFEYLREARDSNGGFPESSAKREPNVASTAWVGAGDVVGGDQPRRMAHALRSSDRRTARLSGLDAAAGRPHPLQGKPGTERHVDDRLRRPRVRRQPAADPRGALRTHSRAPPGRPADSGDGGESTSPGRRRDRRRWRNGAPLFSRPAARQQGPHSRWRARQPKSRKHDRPRTHKLNPALPAKHPSRQPPAPASTTPRNAHQQEQPARPQRHRRSRADRHRHRRRQDRAAAERSKGC